MAYGARKEKFKITLLISNVYLYEEFVRKNCDKSALAKCCILVELIHKQDEYENDESQEFETFNTISGSRICVSEFRLYVY